MYDRAYYLQRAALAAELAERAGSDSLRRQYREAEAHWRALADEAAEPPDGGSAET